VRAQERLAVPALLPLQVVAVRHRPRDSAIRRVLAGADVLALVLVQLVVLGLVGRAASGEQLLWAAVALPAWVVIFKAYGLYDRDIKRISHTTIDDLPWVFHAMIVGSLLLLLFFRLVPARDLSPNELLAIAGLTTPTVLGLRAFGRRAAGRVLGDERVLLVGEGPHIDAIAHKMRMNPEYRLRPVGVLSGTSGEATGRAGVPLLGQVSDDLTNVLMEQRIDRVVVSHVDVDEENLLQVVRRCRELSIKCSVLPQIFDAMGPSVEVDDVEGITVLGITPPVLPSSSRLLKRCVDTVGAASLLILFAPLLLPLALAIKLGSPGPVLFRQERVGRRGRRFQLVKFRTMHVDAEALHDELAARSRDPNWLLIDDDPRVTRVGKFLRQTSLDELPQLWNVLKGEMSLVGPRPILPSHVEQLNGWRLSRADLTPGLTGLWQVLGRTNIPFDEMIKLDYLYVTNWSLWTDFRLMLRTISVVLRRRGAN
jgi:exopolysaccharide biosynthesis polyprenyl glycosylphosphotransferase